MLTVARVQAKSEKLGTPARSALAGRAQVRQHRFYSTVFRLLGGIASAGLVVGQEMHSKSIPRDTIPYTEGPDAHIEQCRAGAHGEVAGWTGW